MAKKECSFNTAELQPILRIGTRAVTAIEFAFLAPIVIILLSMVVEVGIQSTVAAALDYGARRASRLGITGALIPNGPVASDSAREAAVRQAVLSATGGLLVDSRLTITQSSFASVAAASSGTGAVSGPGGSGQVVRYDLSYVQPLIIGNLFATLLHRTEFNHRSTVLVINEPYPNK